MFNTRKLILFLILVVVACIPVFAANGDTLTIGGAVPLVLDLTVTPNASADILDLHSADTANTAVIATISITTNSAAGWELWAFSANAATSSRLISADGREIPYTITYVSDTGTISNVETDTAIPNAGLMIADDLNVADVSRTGTGTISVTYTRNTAYAAGYYSDLLTLTLRAK